MKKLKQSQRMISGERAEEKRRVIQYNKLASYKVTEDNDIIIVSGPYAGRKVRALWLEGSDQRDYIYKNLYQRGDEIVVQILKELFCD